MSHTHSHASLEAYKYSVLGYCLYCGQCLIWDHWPFKVTLLVLLTMVLSALPFYPLAWYHTLFMLSCLLVIKDWKYADDKLIYY